jgi:hypothetical protein
MPSHRVQSFVAASLLAALLNAHDAGSGQLTASWEDTSGGLTGFILERRLTAEPAFTPVGDLPPGFTSYVDPAISDGMTYCYRVKAYDAIGESPYSDEACGASMPLPPSGYSIAVLKSGTGTGSVVSAPAGINCGIDCEEAYGSGTLVTLKAAAAYGSTFVGWSGGCAGTSSCIISANSAVTVTATFTAMSARQLKVHGARKAR